jgi:hypothetical protein
MRSLLAALVMIATFCSGIAFAGGNSPMRPPLKQTNQLALDVLEDSAS